MISIAENIFIYTSRKTENKKGQAYLPTPTKRHWGIEGGVWKKNTQSNIQKRTSLQFSRRLRTEESINIVVVQALTKARLLLCNVWKSTIY